MELIVCLVRQRRPATTPVWLHFVCVCVFSLALSLSLSLCRSLSLSLSLSNTQQGCKYCHMLSQDVMLCQESIVQESMNLCATQESIVFCATQVTSLWSLTMQINSCSFFLSLSHVESREHSFLCSTSASEKVREMWFISSEHRRSSGR